MKLTRRLRGGGLLIALLSLAGAEGAAGASIGLFSTADCGSCNLVLQQGETRTLYIRAITGGLVGDGLVGAGLKVAGLPMGWIAVSTPNPEATVTIGDPFGPDGARIGFSAFIPGTCISLYTVAVTATTSVTEGRLYVVGVPSWDHTVVCPLITPGCSPPPCDAEFCVEGGTLFINSTSECNVAAQNAGWSHMKHLYR